MENDNFFENIRVQKFKGRNVPIWALGAVGIRNQMPSGQDSLSGRWAASVPLDSGGGKHGYTQF